MRRSSLAVLCAVLVSGAGLASAAQAAAPAPVAAEVAADGAAAAGSNARQGLPAGPVGSNLAAAPSVPDARPARAPRAGSGPAAQAGPVTSATASATLPSTRGPGFVPLRPQRILDTRSGVGAPTGPLGQGRSLTFAVGTRLPAGVAAATAVVLNVTVAGATSGGYLTVFPAGGTLPNTSSLNFAVGQTVANSVTVRLGAGGAVAVYNGSRSAHVIVDVAGFYEAGGSFQPVTPMRFLDTRTAIGVPTRSPLEAGRVLTATVTGVPSTAAAVTLNVTAVSATAPGFLTVFPAGTARPATSTLNLLPGRSSAVAVYTALGAGGRVSFISAAGSVQVLADVSGWFTAGGAYVPVAPARDLDTRRTFGTLDSGFYFDPKVTGYNEVADVNVTAVVLSVTAVAPTGDGYLAVAPYTPDEVMPSTSSVNFSRGVTTPNLVISKVGANGLVRIYNGSGAAAAVLVDVLGFFTTDAVPAYPVGVHYAANVDQFGRQNGLSFVNPCGVAASVDGRYVAFASRATTMVPYLDATVPNFGMYVRDTALGTTSLVAWSDRTHPCPVALSPDGRWLMWTSTDQFLQADLNGAADVFASDLSRGWFYQLSWNIAAHRAPAGSSDVGGMSPDARFFAFQTTADDVAAGDTHTGSPDVVLLDTEAPGGWRYTWVAPGAVSTQPVSLALAPSGRPRVVLDASTPITATAGYVGPVVWDGVAASPLSVAAGGAVRSGATTANGRPVVSSDGSTAAFATTVGLVAADVAGTADVYVRTLPTRTTTAVASAAQVADEPLSTVQPGWLSGDGDSMLVASTRPLYDGLYNISDGPAQLYRWQRGQAAPTRVNAAAGAPTTVVGSVLMAPRLGDDGAFAAWYGYEQGPQPAIVTRLR